MIKIDIVAGFYGAGKTRFIKKIMSEGIEKKTISYLKCSSSKGEFDAFSMNLFGINGFEIKVNEETKFYKETIVSALRNILELYEPKRIVIETAGNMSLSKIIEAVNQVLVPGWISMNAVVTIVDANMGVKNMEKYPHIFREQIENSQSIVLSRTEDINKEELFAHEVALRKLNSHATVFVTKWDAMEGTNMRNAMEVTSQLESIVRHITAKEKLPLVYDIKKSEEYKVFEEQKKLKGMILHTNRIFSEGEVKKSITSLLDSNKEIIRLKGSFLNIEQGSIRVDYLQGKLLILNEKIRGTGNIQIVGSNLIKEQLEGCVL